MNKSSLQEAINQVWQDLTTMQKVIILLLYKVTPYEIDMATLTEIMLTDYHLITDDKIDDLKAIYFGEVQ